MELLRLPPGRRHWSPPAPPVLADRYRAQDGQIAHETRSPVPKRHRHCRSPTLEAAPVRVQVHAAPDEARMIAMARLPHERSKDIDTEPARQDSQPPWRRLASAPPSPGLGPYPQVAAPEAASRPRGRSTSRHPGGRPVQRTRYARCRLRAPGLEPVSLPGGRRPIAERSDHLIQGPQHAKAPHRADLGSRGCVGGLRRGMADLPKSAGRRVCAIKPDADLHAPIMSGRQCYQHRPAGGCLAHRSGPG